MRSSTSDVVPIFKSAGNFAHVGVADDDVETPVLFRYRVRVRREC